MRQRKTRRMLFLWNYRTTSDQDEVKKIDFELSHTYDCLGAYFCIGKNFFRRHAIYRRLCRILLISPLWILLFTLSVFICFGMSTIFYDCTLVRLDPAKSIPGHRYSSVFLMSCLAVSRFHSRVSGFHRNRRVSNSPFREYV